MRRVIPKIVVILIVAHCARPALGADLVFPKLTDRVVDAAGLLDEATKMKLIAALADHELISTDQVAVATVPSLQGYTVEEYANRLFRHWRLGQKELNNGILLLVAPTERKVRIEVGYGLEGLMTDAIAGSIIQQKIVPAFQSGDFEVGIVDGTQAILDTIAGISRQRPPSANHMADWVFTIVFVSIWGGLICWWAYYSSKNPGAFRSEDDLVAGRTRFGGGSSSGGGGFSGGGGSSGGGGASGSW